ncbi:MAG: hypothetical protein MHM6MM_007134 [Cercozoa sp. M6MM]
MPLPGVATRQLGVPALKLSTRKVAEYVRVHRPHFDFSFCLPRYGARRAERIAAAESIARVAEAHARSSTRHYGTMIAEQVAAGVRRRERQLAVQRQLGSLVALHAAFVAAQQEFCASYHCLASEMPFYVPPDKRSPLLHLASKNTARVCLAINRALGKQELTAQLASKLLVVHLDLLKLQA